jgi:hypothetical protein
MVVSEQPISTPKRAAKKRQIRQSSFDEASGPSGWSALGSGPAHGHSSGKLPTVWLNKNIFRLGSAAESRRLANS